MAVLIGNISEADAPLSIISYGYADAGSRGSDFTDLTGFSAAPQRDLGGRTTALVESM
jgi:hypothetical protein